VSLFGVVVAGQLAGRSAERSGATAFNVGLTLLGRGEFSIIVAKLAQSGAFDPTVRSPLRINTSDVCTALGERIGAHLRVARKTLAVAPH